MKIKISKPLIEDWLKKLEENKEDTYILELNSIKLRDQNDGFLMVVAERGGKSAIPGYDDALKRDIARMIDKGIREQLGSGLLASKIFNMITGGQG